VIPAGGVTGIPTCDEALHPQALVTLLALGCQTVCHDAAPAFCPKVWLVKRIAWRLQAQAEGDLSERTRRRAAELVDADVKYWPRPANGSMWPTCGSRKAWWAKGGRCTRPRGARAREEMKRPRRLGVIAWGRKRSQVQSKTNVPCESNPPPINSARDGGSRRCGSRAVADRMRVTSAMADTELRSRFGLSPSAAQAVPGWSDALLGAEPTLGVRPPNRRAAS
jgi:hypothetical protein